MAALAATVLAAAGLAACGSGDGPSGPNARPVTLLLDFTPNPVHAGIYAATANGYDRDAGVALRIREPSASTDALRLLAAGKADLAVLDIHDLGLARQKGRDIVGVMALVQRPLAAVLADPSVGTPRALEGRRAGVTGLPSDDAVLRSVVTGAGGDPKRVDTVTIGFNAVASLLTGRVAGATAFWNVEGVALRAKRPGIRIFKVNDYGAPAYPELVVCATRATLRSRPALVRRTLAALAAGYRFAIRRPGAALGDLLAASPGLDRALSARELAAVRPVWAAGGRFGRLDLATLRAWSAWDVRFGILARPVDVRRAFAGPFVGGR
ncbi:MAG: ABC transporter substrate-binding protein [Solirubrobacteraceae bacterium]